MGVVRRSLFLAFAVLAVYAIVVPVTLWRAIPDPVLHPDSPTYLRPALERLFIGHFTINPMRSAGYPCFLYLALRLLPAFATILITQHVLHLLTAALAAVLYTRKFEQSWGTAALIFFAVAVSPVALLSAHAILTETLYSFLFLLSLCFFFWAGDGNSAGRWVGAGVCVSLALWIRPAGWALVPGGLASVLYQGRRRWLRAAMGFGGALLLTLGAFSLESYVHRGFFGLTRFGGLTLFGATARWLDVGRVSPEELRAALLPFYQDPVLRRKLMNNDWVRYGEDGPVKTLTRAGLLSGDSDRTLGTLARQALWNHPGAFLAEQVRQGVEFLRYGAAIPDIYLDPSYSFFVYRGLNIFRRSTEDIPAAWTLMTHRWDQTESYRAALDRLAHENNTESVRAAMDAVAAADLYHYEWVVWLLKPFSVFFRIWSWIPILALVATILAWRERQWRPASVVLWTTMIAHIGLGDLSMTDPRYWIPIEPIQLVLLAAGLRSATSLWLTRTQRVGRAI